MSLIRRRPTTAPEEGGGGGLYFTSPKTNLQFVHSGCAVLDCVLAGGWPLGRIANVVGDKSTGKTLIAIEACANFLRQYRNGDVLYVETESAFDQDYAKALGLDVERVTFATDVETVEQLFNLLEAFMENRADKPGLVVVDSLDALSDESELKRGIAEGSYGAGKAKQMSQLFRRSVRKLGTTRTCVMIISQVRDNIGVSFGEKHSRSGGRALDFYASQVVWLAHLKTIKRTVDRVERATALTIRARCKKNKIGLPLRECEFDLRFGYGIEDIEACVAFLTAVGKASLVPTVKELRRMRGREFTEARTRLNAAVTQAWYAVERNFVPSQGKYFAE